MGDTMKAFAKRNSDKTIRLFFIGLMIAIIGMFSHNVYAKTAAEIDASSAKALLVMSGVTKAGFGVGGTYGQGALQIGGKTVGYYNLIGGSAGFTFGAEQMDIIIAFMTEEALNQFKNIDGWEVGVTGNVAIIDVGGGKRLDTTSLKDAVVAFVFDAKGLIVDVSLKGAKFTKINK
jgi:lipid-binding SYLF domain-containing protein